MKIKLKEIYLCDHCNKLYQIKNRCAEHEKVCGQNPLNQRPCFRCLNLKKVKTSVWQILPNGYEKEREVNLLYCDAKKHFLYPPKVEYKKNYFDVGEDDENKPMPKSCDLLDKSRFF